jgi:hypothetical protein
MNSSINRYQIRRYRECTDHLEVAKDMIRQAYGTISDLSNNSIELFAARDYMETCGFINRLQTLCDRRIQQLEGEANEESPLCNSSENA